MVAFFLGGEGSTNQSLLTFPPPPFYLFIYLLICLFGFFFFICFLFLFWSEDQLARPSYTLLARSSAQWLSELRRLWTSVP